MGGGVVYLDTTMNYHGRGDSPRKDPQQSDPKAQDYFETAIGRLSVPRRRNSGISTPEIFVYDGGNGPLDERKLRWKDLSMDFVTGLPISMDWKGTSYDLILVIVNRLYTTSRCRGGYARTLLCVTVSA